MSELVANCPVCGAQKITFDVIADHYISKSNWRKIFDAFCECSHCHSSVVFMLEMKDSNSTDAVNKGRVARLNGAANDHFMVRGYRSLKDFVKARPPEHLPTDLEAVFIEGATCHAVGCFNASATMFRLCVDLATVPLLPKTDNNGLNSAVRRSLGLRLKWLFEQRILPEALKELSTCIQQDGNDGAHAGTLTKKDAEDLLDFTSVLLERLYTEPERLKQAKERRENRRKQ